MSDEEFYKTISASFRPPGTRLIVNKTAYLMLIRLCRITADFAFGNLSWREGRILWDGEPLYYQKRLDHTQSPLIEWCPVDKLELARNK